MSIQEVASTPLVQSLTRFVIPLVCLLLRFQGKAIMTSHPSVIIRAYKVHMSADYAPHSLESPAAPMSALKLNSMVDPQPIAYGTRTDTYSPIACS